LGLLSAIYSAALAGRRFIYSSFLKKPKKLPASVISIGNLTLGGTGKTPAVIAVAQEAKKRGLRPCILTRGYKGRVKGPCLMSRDGTLLLNAHQAGDEPLLMAKRLEGIPVVKGNNRFLAGVYALGELGPGAIDIFILDDGFQHWGLHRDADILLIDATNPFGNERLFPEGILREPMDSIKRAGIIVITKSDMVSSELITAINLKVKQYNPQAALYVSSHKPVALVNVSGDIRDIDSLNHAQIYAFAGIANPSYFKNMLVSKGADIVKFKSFRDHYIYRQRDIKKITADAQGLEIITTEKDLVKLGGLTLPENISALRIEFSINETFFDDLFKRVADNNTASSGGRNDKEHHDKD